MTSFVKPMLKNISTSTSPTTTSSITSNHSNVNDDLLEGDAIVCCNNIIGVVKYIGPLYLENNQRTSIKYIGIECISTTNELNKDYINGVYRGCRYFYSTKNQYNGLLINSKYFKKKIDPISLLKVIKKQYIANKKLKQNMTLLKKHNGLLKNELRNMNKKFKKLSKKQGRKRKPVKSTPDLDITKILKLSDIFRRKSQSFNTDIINSLDSPKNSNNNSNSVKDNNIGAASSQLMRQNTDLMGLTPESSTKNINTKCIPQPSSAPSSAPISVQTSSLFGNHSRNNSSLFGNHTRNSSPLFGNHSRNNSSLFGNHYSNNSSLLGNHYYRNSSSLFGNHSRNNSNHGNYYNPYYSYPVYMPIKTTQNNLEFANKDSGNSSQLIRAYSEVANPSDLDSNVTYEDSETEDNDDCKNVHNISTNLPFKLPLRPITSGIPFSPMKNSFADVYATSSKNSPKSGDKNNGIKTRNNSPRPSISATAYSKSISDQGQYKLQYAPVHFRSDLQLKKDNYCNESSKLMTVTQTDTSLHLYESSSDGDITDEDTEFYGMEHYDGFLTDKST